MSRIPVTYCTNVHPGATLEEAAASLAGPVREVARGSRRAGPFPVGMWWSRAMVRALKEDPGRLETFQELLAGLDLVPATVNVFPAGDFHGERVGEAVFEPGWDQEERFHYTVEAAEILSRLLPEGGAACLSTVPLGYRRPGLPPPDLRRMARNLVRAASRLAALEERTGRRLSVALEPEPACLLETVEDAVAFLQDRVLGDGSLDVPEGALRRHLGLCVDLCHLAVVGEEPLEALARCFGAGIAVGKVQVSCALEARLESHGRVALQELLAFHEPRYLHQTSGFACGGRRPVARALDLEEVGRRAEEFAPCALLRSHFHVPVFWDASGALGSTRAGVEQVLRAPLQEKGVPLLEVETYTWSVLPPASFPGAGSGGALVEGIVAELAFVEGMLAGSPHGGPGAPV